MKVFAPSPSEIPGLVGAVDAALFDMDELLEPDRDVVVDEPGDAMAPALALDEPVVRRAKRAVFESPEERL